jgi:hypothetical protein
MGRSLRHPSCAAQRAKTTPFAGERHQLVVTAVTTAQAQKAVGKNAALEKCLELVLDELGNAGSCACFDLGEKSRGVLLNGLEVCVKRLVS